MQPNAIDNERLQEQLLDLLRRNDNVQQREMDAAVLLDIIQVIGSAQSRIEVIKKLIQGLQVITGHQEMTVLERSNENALLWTSSYANSDLLSSAVWRSGKVFERVSAGDVVVLFKPQQIEEFQEQEPEICQFAGSALVFGLESLTGTTLLLLMHRDKNVFNPTQRESIRRLKPIIEQRLQNLEYDIKLRDIVTKRTSELRNSQKRLVSFARSSSDWFWEVDSELKYSYTSRANEDDSQQMGHSLYGKTVLELRTPAESQNLNKWFELTRLFQERQPIRDFDCELDFPISGRTWVRINGEAFYSEQGVFSGYRGTAKNISSYKLQNRQLSQQIQQVSTRTNAPEKAAPRVEPKNDKVPHILLVDDCESSQMITRLMLVNLGYTTSVIESGVKALEFDQLNTVDAILMDLEMPDMSGEDVCRQLRLQGIEIPILALTGYRFGERGEQVADAGMNGFIEKPVRLNVLQEELGKLF